MNKKIFKLTKKELKRGDRMFISHPNKVDITTRIMLIFLFSYIGLIIICFLVASFNLFLNYFVHHNLKNFDLNPLYIFGYLTIIISNIFILIKLYQDKKRS